MKIQLSRHELYSIMNGSKVTIIHAPIMDVTVHKVITIGETCYAVQCIFHTKNIDLPTRSQQKNYDMTYTQKAYLDDIEDPETMFQMIYVSIQDCEIDLANQLDFVRYIKEHNLADDPDFSKGGDCLDLHLQHFIEQTYCNNLLEDCYKILQDVCDDNEQED